MHAAARMTIPSDIVTEILYRLPAKSVARFRCASKGWQSIITDPKFIKTHLVTLNRNHHIFKRGYCLYTHPFHHHDPWMFEPTKLPGIDLRRAMTFQGSCDGLVLVSLYIRGLAVFNPSTRESVRLPQAPGHYPHHLRNHDQECVRSKSTHGIGYDSVTDDYKVITLTSFQFSTHDIEDPYRYRHVRNWVTSTSIRVSIYSLRSNTWRKLFIDHSPYDFYNLSDVSFHVVYSNGYFHWFGTKKDTNPSKVLVAFSLVDECLREVPSPNFCNDTRIMSEYHCKLIVLGGKLAIYVIPEAERSHPMKFEAWLMNEYGVKESWTRIPLDIFNDGDLCMPDSIFDDNGKIRMATENNMLTYDFEKRTLSGKVYIRSCKFCPFGSYVESLVSPKQKLQLRKERKVTTKKSYNGTR